MTVAVWRLPAATTITGTSWDAYVRSTFSMKGCIPPSCRISQEGAADTHQGRYDIPRTCDTSPPPSPPSFPAGDLFTSRRAIVNQDLYKQNRNTRAGDGGAGNATERRAAEANASCTIESDKARHISTNV